MLRLKVVEYFDSVINQIDLFTETKILQKDTKISEEWLNKRRDRQIEAVKQIEQACLTQLAEVKKENEREWKEKVFVEYCFVVEYRRLLFLATSKRYVDSNEIEFVTNRLRWDVLSENEITNFFVKEGKVANLQCCFGEDFQNEIKYYDSPIIEIDTYLGQVVQVDSMSLSLEENYVPILEFNSRVQIQKFTLCFHHSFNPSDVEKLIKSLKQSTVESIKLFTQILDQDAEFLSYLKSLRQHEPGIEQITIIVGDDDSIFIQCNEHNTVRQMNLNTPFLALSNWHHITLLDLIIASEEQLKNLDFANTSSIQKLFLKIIFNSDSEAVYQLPSRVFRGLTQLEHLDISVGRSKVELEQDDGEALFADFKQLVTLSVPIYFLRLFDHQTLKKLQLQGKPSEAASFDLKLPSLRSLHIDRLQDASIFFLSSVSHSLSHITQLRVSLNSTSEGCFRGFKCLTKLILDVSDDDCLESKTLDGLDKLTHLEVNFSGNQTMHHDALSKLTSLETVQFKFDIVPFDFDLKKPFDLDDQSVFDGLFALRKITYSLYFKYKVTTRPCIRELVHFGNLHRLVLIHYSIINISDKS